MDTPERRAIERIKRKATGMAIPAVAAATAEGSAEGDLRAPEDRAADSAQPPLARKCRCADAEVKAYRDGTDWICHTCGYELSARASHELDLRARMGDRDRPPRARDGGDVQPACRSPG